MVAFCGSDVTEKGQLLLRTLALIHVGARVREFSVGVVHLHIWADAEVKQLLIRKRGAKNYDFILYVYLFACGF